VTRFWVALYRSSLRLYPRPFRREYEEPLVQALLDRRTFGQRRFASVVVHELADVAASALRMRGEPVMSTFVLVVVTLVAAVLAALAAGPLAVVPVLVVAVGVLAGMRSHDRGLDAVGSHPLRWIAAAVAAIGVAVAIPLVAGEELSEPAWALMAVCAVAGLAAGLTGIGSLLAAPRAAQP
jgi:hypothetical protein